MSKFKAGDRVIVKGFGMVGGESTDLENRKASIQSILPTPGRMEVLADGDGWNVIVYQSQCVRLKPKSKTREWWIREHTPYCIFARYELCMSKNDLEDSFCIRCPSKVINIREVTHVKEVRK